MNSIKASSAEIPATDLRAGGPSTPRHPPSVPRKPDSGGVAHPSDQGKRIITRFERARIYPCHKRREYAGLQPLREGLRQKKHPSGPKQAAEKLFLSDVL